MSFKPTFTTTTTSTTTNRLSIVVSVTTVITPSGSQSSVAGIFYWDVLV